MSYDTLTAPAASELAPVADDMSAYVDGTTAYVLTESGNVYKLASDCHS